MAMKYTAQEMREASLWFYYPPNSTGKAKRFDRIEISAMLRQAADEKMRMESLLGAIEKEFKKQSICRACEWRGKSIRSEPACPCDEDENYSVYEIDIIDRLRQAADLQEREEKREKKYEYAARSNYDGFIDPEHCEESKLEHTFSCMKCDEYTVVRREVGEWEEVE